MSDIDFNERILSGDLAKSGYSELFGDSTLRPSLNRSSLGLGPESESESVCLDEPGRMSEGVGTIKLKPVKLDRKKVKKAVHVASVALEESATTAAETVRSRPFTLRALRPDEEFSCKGCSRATSSRCAICGGSRRFGAQDSIVQFFEYIIGFKAGLLPSYTGKEGGKSLSGAGKTIVNNFCNDFFAGSGGRESTGGMRQSIRASQRRSELSGTCRKSKEEVVSELNKMVTVHASYRCDQCDCHPIVGVRWHCETCPDYDICGKCREHSQHEHPLSNIEKCHAKGKQLESMIHFIAQPRQEPSLRPPPSILNLPTPSISKSSIR